MKVYDKESITVTFFSASITAAWIGDTVEVYYPDAVVTYRDVINEKRAREIFKEEGLEFPSKD